MDTTVLACLIIASIAGCSAIAGSIAMHKRRSPYEGVLLGLFLGPLGVLLEFRCPDWRRPPVDENAWNSLRSMTTYQELGRDPGRRPSTTMD
jgi:hypothetical protein